MERQFLERTARQRAYRIEGDVAEELDPDLLTEPRRHGHTEARCDQHVCESLEPFRPCSARLAQGQSISLGVMNHAWLRDVRREVGQRADNALRFDGLRDRAARIDALQVETVQVAWMVLEI